MIVDSSAILAVLLKEPEGAEFLSAMASAPRVRISAANWLEAAMVLDRRGDAGAVEVFDRVVDCLGIEITPLTRNHVAHARAAWQMYGRGTRHPGKRNFGDCMAYGFAVSERESLLFKGNEFAQADITPALGP